VLSHYKNSWCAAEKVRCAKARLHATLVTTSGDAIIDLNQEKENE
jgi:hypothetical protein